MTTLMHKTATATVEATTDEGTFLAIAAAYSTDRQGEEIVPGAFTLSIARWQASGKDVPVHWNHDDSAEAVIGSIDPRSMVERADGLHVAGRLDLEDSELAREAWRSVKGNRIALSFGYLATKTAKRDDGVTLLEELDLYEVSLTPAPANADTRVLSWKSAGADVVPDTAAEPTLDLRAEALRRNTRAGMAEVLTAPDAPPIGSREHAEAVVAEIESQKAATKSSGPIQVASFDA